MPEVECYFDCSSPWSYMGFSNLLTLSARLGIAVKWRPVVVGFIFGAANAEIYTSRRLTPAPLKNTYELKEMQDWATHAGLIVRVPPACGHPINSISCMRGCVALEQEGKMIPFAIAAYEALWRDGRNLGHSDVLADVCRTVGVDPDRFFAEIAGEQVKQRLKANNDELVRRGGYGVPTFFVDGEMFFGNNRLVLVEDALRRRIRLDGASVAGRATEGPGR